MSRTPQQGVRESRRIGRIVVLKGHTSVFTYELISAYFLVSFPNLLNPLLYPVGYLIWGLVDS